MAEESNTNNLSEDFINSAQEEYKITNNAATDLLKNVVKKNKDHYKSGGGMNSAFRTAGQFVPKDIFTKILKINKITEKSQKNKTDRTDLYARLETWKRERISDKANINSLVEAVSSDLINYELMSPEYKTLLAQVIDKDGNLNHKGLKLHNRKLDDKLMVQYTVNRVEKEHAYNEGLKGISVDTTPGVAIEEISFEDLMGGIHYKQLGAETSVYETVTGQANEATLMNKNSKTYKISSWSEGINSGESKVRKALTSVIKGDLVVSDLATRDIFGKGSTYRDDLSGLIGGMDLSKIGLVDKGKPGYEDDLANNALLKEKIIGMKINPKTPKQVKDAELSLINYCLNLAGQAFNNKRDEITEPNGTTLAKSKGDSAKDLIKKYSA